MHTLLESLEPFHQLQDVAELGFWGRHQRDAKLRAMARLFVGCALRWSLITALLLAADESLPQGVLAWVLAILAAIACSFVVVIATTAAALVIGSMIRTA